MIKMKLKKLKNILRKKVNGYYKEVDDFYEKNKKYIDSPTITDKSEEYYDRYLDLLDKADAKRYKLESVNSLPKMRNYVPKSGRKKAFKNAAISGGAIAGATHIANKALRNRLPAGEILAKGNRILGGIGIIGASSRAYKPLSEIKQEITTDLVNRDAIENYHRDLHKKNKK